MCDDDKFRVDLCRCNRVALHFRSVWRMKDRCVLKLSTRFNSEIQPMVGHGSSQALVVCGIHGLSCLSCSGRLDDACSPKRRSGRSNRLEQKVTLLVSDPI